MSVMKKSTHRDEKEGPGRSQDKWNGRARKTVSLNATVHKETEP